MTWSHVRAIARRFIGLFRRAADERTLDDEIAYHLERQVESNMRAGLAPDEARRAALIAFGGRTQARDTALDAIRARRLESVASDVRFALRGMRRNAGFTLAAIAIVGLGIGASLVVFRFADALLLEPLPARAPQELIEVWNANLGASSDLERHVPFSYPEYAYVRDHVRSVDGLAAIDGDPALLSWRTSAGADLVRAQFVSASMFSTLAVSPAIGRTLLPSDDAVGSAAPGAVVSFAFWQARLGSAQSALGQTMVINGTSFTIVGVAPRGFTGALGGLSPDVWLPLSSAGTVRHDAELLDSHDTAWLIVIGRLHPGVVAAQAASELKVLGEQFAHETYAREHLSVEVFPATLVPGPFRAYVAAFIGLLQAIVFLVLMIACANATNLFIAQASSRRAELAVRAAMGASRARLMQQMLTESILLASFAAVAGGTAAMITSPLLLRLLPASLPVHLELGTNWRTVAFAAGLAVIAGTALGWIPAMRTTSDLFAIMKRGRDVGFRRSRLRDALVVAQVSVSLLLLVAGGLCLRSFALAASTNPGFAIRDRVAVSVDLKGLGYSSAATHAFYQSLIGEIARVPGVTRATIASYLPLEPTYSSVSMVVLDRPDWATAKTVQSFDVGPDYFATLGESVLRGRDFARADDEGNPRVVIVNEAMARSIWHGEDAIGRLVQLRGPTDQGYVSYRVVGVVPTGKYRSLGERPRGIVFRAALQHDEPKATVVVHSSAAAAVAIAEVRKVIGRLDPDLAVVRAGPLADQLSIALFPARVTSILLGSVGGLGLALALVGLAALVAYAVACRQREIGIRMALGARSATIIREMSGDSMRLLAIGMLAGWLAAFAFTRFLAGVLFGVSPLDPSTFAVVTVVLFVAGGGVTLLMARRAAAVDPMAALRQD